jgi:MFS family permease
MSQPSPAGSTGQTATLGELTGQLSQQISTLVRDELRLAQAELTAKGKRAGIGAGFFGAAGVIAAYAVGALIAAAILGLAGPVDDWLAALIVGVVLLVAAGVAAFVGKRAVSKAAPLAPTEALAGVKQDVNAIKPGRS